MVAIARPTRRFIRRLLDTGEADLDGVRLITDQAIIGAEARDLILSKAYEKPERDLVKEAITPDDRVLEFGGCLGLLSLVCARIVGEKNVLCYEPNPVACAIIRRNYDLNAIHPELREKALTVDGGQIEFFQTDNLFSSSIYERNVAGGRISVPSDSFAAVVADWKPTAIVIDVEGAECELLPSSDLIGVRKIILETHEKIVGKERNDALLAHLANVGFTLRSSQHGRGYFTR